MKVRLVVNQGPQKGKEIPVSTSAKFTIGRGEGCQLRPASQAISKKHCTIEVRDGKCFLEDHGSTNGTFVNNEQLQGERQISNGDSVKIGPLEFLLKLVESTPPAAVTPPPEPPPTKKAPAAAAPKKPAAPPKPVKTAADGVDEEDVAAMLLDLDESSATASDALSAPMEEEEEVAGGSTIMDILLPQKENSPAPAPYRPQSANKSDAPANTSNAAKEILEKYRRRPRT